MRNGRRILAFFLLFLLPPGRQGARAQILSRDLYAVSNYENVVWRFSPPSGAKSIFLHYSEFPELLAGACCPLSIAVHPYTGHLYVGNSTGELLKIEVLSDGSRGSVEIFADDTMPWKRLVFEPVTTRLFASTDSEIYTFDEWGTKMLFVTDWSRLYDLQHVAIRPFTGNIFVCTGFYNEVIRYDPQGNFLGTFYRFPPPTAYPYALPIAPFFVGDDFYCSAIPSSSPIFSVYRFTDTAPPPAEVAGGFWATWSTVRDPGTGCYFFGDHNGNIYRTDASFGSKVTFSTIANGVASLAFRAADGDGDGLFDHVEDADGDGVAYPRLLHGAVYETDPGDPDTDGDGLEDGEEFFTHGTDPTDPDSDCDGLSDGDEVDVHSTDPLDTDSDDDGVYDGLSSSGDADGDGAVDAGDVSYLSARWGTSPCPVWPDADRDGTVSEGDLGIVMSRWPD